MYSSYKTNWRRFKSKWRTYTNPRPDQYLPHAHSHITHAVVAMDSCFSLSMPLLCYHFADLWIILFPEARFYWSAPLIWSILGASRDDHSPCPVPMQPASVYFLFLVQPILYRSPRSTRDPTLVGCCCGLYWVFQVIFYPILKLARLLQFSNSSMLQPMNIDCKTITATLNFRRL